MFAAAGEVVCICKFKYAYSRLCETKSLESLITFLISRTWQASKTHLSVYRRVNINSLSPFSSVLNTSFIKETRSYDFSCVIRHVIITCLSLSNSNCFIRNEHLIINETRTYGFSYVIIRLYINMHFSLYVIRQQSGHFASFNFKLGRPRVNILEDEQLLL